MKTLLLITASLIAISTIGQTTIIQQDFNAGMPSGWQLIDNDNMAPYNDPAVNFITDAYVLTEDYDSLGIGDNILVATSWHEAESEADDYLILPKLTMGAIGNYISFDAKSVDASHPDGLEVRVSLGGVNVWDFFNVDAAYSNPAVNPYWTNYVVSLDSVGLANEDIFIAFRHRGEDQYILAIDNIKVWIEDPVSINENTEKSLSIFPNPASNNVNLNIPNDTYFEIIDVMGKVAISDTYNGGINISNLPSGVYFVKVKNFQVQKLVIN